MSEVEMKSELKEQGVVVVRIVTVKRDTEKVPTNTPFLTFSTPEMPKEITTGYLKVKVTLFVPNPTLIQPQQVWLHEPTLQSCCKMLVVRGKNQHEGRCEEPKLCADCNGFHASSALDCPVWKKKTEIQRNRVEKHISFTEARQLIEAGEDADCDL